MAGAAALVAVVVGAIAVTAASKDAEPKAERTKAAASPSAGATETPPAATEPPGTTVSFSAVGDIIMGSTPKLPPNDGRTFFDDVKPDLRADVAMGNFEGALTNETTSTKCQPTAPSPLASSTAAPGTFNAPPPPSPPVAPGPPPNTTMDLAGAAPSTAPDRCFAFRMPPTYAQWIRDAGFTVLNLANNHARDYGTKGLADTRAALDAHGVAYTGARGQIARLRIGDVRVAVLGFAPYSWTQSVVDIDAAKALVQRASSDSDIVVVNMHAGAEGPDRTHVRPGTETFLGENRGDPIRFAHAVVDAGADLVVGHSPHVMRGMEWYKGRLIAYSMGNFAGYRTLSSAGPLGVGGILKVTLRPDGSWAGGSLVATRMVNGGLPARDPGKRALTLVDGLSVADLGATAVRVAPSGELTVPKAG